jgi:hypothetical protein
MIAYGAMDEAPFGADTRALLNELGFSEDEVAVLLAERVTRESLA